MIEATGLTKRYGSKTAVDNVTFSVKPGQVTGFLGPNGAGKSTTMRLAVGLDRPSGGTITINGRRYADLKAPLREVGVLLDAKAVHTGRSAINHLRALAATHSIGRARVDEVIALAGLESVARKRVGGFSLGMGQRLGIAAALLGDPATLILDEPVNGLDPEGVIWVRNLARFLASEGRTVFLSSHLMSEMAQTADHIIVLGRGRIIADAPVNEILALATGTAVLVRTPDAERFGALLAAPDITIAHREPHLLQVTGLSAAMIGELAASNCVVLHELSPQSGSLEDAYLALTKDEVEYHAGEVAR
ncbi:ATP-binding cassette domain-containing protein [Frigoribacterium sp. CG_9.8]|uniref:ABC transporter ATP-binding protein n=1 Tax=Frigoribacterium sp. CG_9.8 TaxID=2787733 RepID=UPI0018CA5AB5|nr:ABC-2 type transport system ATP-binding protein [Frigoribacterium sp. CG_9.8]